MSRILGSYSNSPSWIMELIVLSSMIIYTAAFSSILTPFQVKFLALIMCLDVALQFLSPKTRVKILDYRIPGESYHQYILVSDPRLKDVVFPISQCAAFVWLCSWLFGPNLRVVAFWTPICILVAIMIITPVVKTVEYGHYLDARTRAGLKEYLSNNSTKKRALSTIDEEPEILGDFDNSAGLLDLGQTSISGSTVQG